MRRRLTPAVALLTVVVMGVVPANAKAKHKPITGSYKLQLAPDPTPDVTQQVRQSGCDDRNPAATNKHLLTIPAKGTLSVVLDSPNPLPTTTPVGPDWDLYIIDTDGSQLDSSHGPTAHEQTVTKFKKGQKVTIEVCNLTGQPNGTVSYRFTFA